MCCRCAKLARPPQFAACALGLFLAFATAAWCWQEQAQRRGPETLDEVAQAAEGLGLYHRSDTQDGRLVNRLVVSETPVSWERATDVRMEAADHPCWRGTVAVTRSWRALMASYVSGRSVVWGDMLVLGDPELIKRLTGIDPVQQPPWLGDGR